MSGGSSVGFACQRWAAQCCSEDEGGCEHDDVFEDVLAFERWRVVGSAEHSRLQQNQRREDPDKLDCQQVDRRAHGPSADEAQTDDALQRSDGDQCYRSGDEPEGEDVRRCRDEVLGGADAGKEPSARQSLERPFRDSGAAA